MNIAVCVKRVPDLAEATVEIDASRRDIRTADLTFGLNDWDRFAVEEAIRLRDEHGGHVTVYSVGDAESDDVLRKALAMGADAAVRLDDPSFASLDALGAARVLAAAIAPSAPDVVLTGAVSSDQGSGALGGLLAELLGLPQVALATSLSVTGRSARVRHEVEGGLERVVDVDLPVVVSVQTGINEPRYVSVRGIRKVADVEIPVRGAADLGLPVPAPRVTTLEVFLPPSGKTAELLQGSTAAVVDQLVDRIKQRGLLS